MKVSEEIFEMALLEFNKIGNETFIEKDLIFKNHPLLVKYENYKYDIRDDARNKLLTDRWKETDLGNGRILTCVSNAINLSSNNLIDWRKKDDFKKLKANRENEKLLFDFFKTKITDEGAFINFFDLGFSYQLIAYLFFIKNYQKYMPISQEQFDKIFYSLGIDFKTSYNCSWDNYTEFNEIISQFKKQLSKHFHNVELLDAHSFLWIYGFQFESLENNPILNQKAKVEEQESIIILENKQLHKLETYIPKKIVDLESYSEDEFEIDYLENHRKLIEIGKKAEKIALEDEIDFLKMDFPDLAEKVRIVSNNPKLGFDILSFETDGKQKQIEVKAISENKGNKSFIITRNELNKSKFYSNYYVYCVTEINSDKPRILRIKNPDFENKDEFLIEPLTFKITFE
jgi:hypothetical protein